MEFRFPKGALNGAKCLTSDMLLDGREAAVFAILLREGESGRAFRFTFGALNQCSFRVRMDLVILADRGGQRFQDNHIDEHVLPIWFDHFATHDPHTWDRYRVRSML